MHPLNPVVFHMNRMSYQARDSRNANSAMIVTVTPEDFRIKEFLAA